MYVAVNVGFKDGSRHTQDPKFWNGQP